MSLNERNIHRQSSAVRRKSAIQRTKRERLHRRPKRLTLNQKKAIRKLKSTGFYKKIGKLRDDLNLPAMIDRAVPHKAVIGFLLAETDARAANLLHAFTNREPAFMSTDTGLAAMQLEALMADEGEGVFDYYIETIISPDDPSFIVAFERGADIEDIEKFFEKQDIVDYECVLKSGDASADDALISDLTLYLCEPRKAGKKTKDADDEENDDIESMAPVKESDYLTVIAEGGLPDAVFEALYGVDRSRRTYIDTNSVRWAERGGRWFPMAEDISKPNTVSTTDEPATRADELYEADVTEYHDAFDTKSPALFYQENVDSGMDEERAYQIARHHAQYIQETDSDPDGPDGLPGGLCPLCDGKHGMVESNGTQYPGCVKAAYQEVYDHYLTMPIEDLTELYQETTGLTDTPERLTMIGAVMQHEQMLEAAGEPFTAEGDEHDGWELKPSYYSKGNMLYRGHTKTSTGFKSYADDFAEALNARYVNREKGYVMSVAKAKKLMDFIKSGDKFSSYDGVRTTKDGKEVSRHKTYWTKKKAKHQNEADTVSPIHESGAPVPHKVYHGTDTKSAKDILKRGVDQQKSQKGYFGKGFYTGLDLDYIKSNYADFSGDADDDQPGAIIAFDVDRKANILDLRRSSDFEEYKALKYRGVPVEKLQGKDDFDKIMRELNVDALYDESFEGYVFYNAKVLKNPKVVYGKVSEDDGASSGINLMNEGEESLRVLQEETGSPSTDEADLKNIYARKRKGVHAFTPLTSQNTMAIGEAYDVYEGDNLVFSCLADSAVLAVNQYVNSDGFDLRESHLELYAERNTAVDAVADYERKLDEALQAEGVTDTDTKYPPTENDKAVLRDLQTGDYPERAEDGKGFCFHWADGRGVCGFKTKKQAIKWLQTPGEMQRDIVKFWYGEPILQSKRFRVYEGETGSTTYALDGAHIARLDEGYEDRIKHLPTETQQRIHDFAAKFGLGPNYVNEGPRKYKCPACGGMNAYYREFGADTGNDEVLLYCPDCKERTDTKPKRDVNESDEDISLFDSLPEDDYTDDPVAYLFTEKGDTVLGGDDPDTDAKDFKKRKKRKAKSKMLVMSEGVELVEAKKTTKKSLGGQLAVGRAELTKTVANMYNTEPANVSIKPIDETDPRWSVAVHGIIIYGYIAVESDTDTWTLRKASSAESAYLAGDLEKLPPLEDTGTQPTDVDYGAESKDPTTYAEGVKALDEFAFWSSNKSRAFTEKLTALPYTVDKQSQVAGNDHYYEMPDGNLILRWSKHTTGAYVVDRVWVQEEKVKDGKPGKWVSAKPSAIDATNGTVAGTTGSFTGGVDDLKRRLLISQAVTTKKPIYIGFMNVPADSPDKVTNNGKASSFSAYTPKGAHEIRVRTAEKGPYKLTSADYYSAGAYVHADQEHIDPDTEAVHVFNVGSIYPNVPSDFNAADFKKHVKHFTDATYDDMPSKELDAALRKMQELYGMNLVKNKPHNINYQTVQKWKSSGYLADFPRVADTPEVKKVLKDINDASKMKGTVTKELHDYNYTLPIGMTKKVTVKSQRKDKAGIPHVHDNEGYRVGKHHALINVGLDPAKKSEWALMHLSTGLTYSAIPKAYAQNIVDALEAKYGDSLDVSDEKVLTTNIPDLASTFSALRTAEDDKAYEKKKQAKVNKEEKKSSRVFEIDGIYNANVFDTEEEAVAFANAHNYALPIKEKGTQDIYAVARNKETGKFHIQLRIGRRIGKYHVRIEPETYDKDHDYGYGVTVLPVMTDYGNVYGTFPDSVYQAIESAYGANLDQASYPMGMTKDLLKAIMYAKEHKGSLEGFTPDPAYANKSDTVPEPKIKTPSTADDYAAAASQAAKEMFGLQNLIKMAQDIAKKNVEDGTVKAPAQIPEIMGGVEELKLSSADMTKVFKAYTDITGKAAQQQFHKDVEAKVAEINAEKGQPEPATTGMSLSAKKAEMSKLVVSDVKVKVVKQWDKTATGEAMRKKFGIKWSDYKDGMLAVQNKKNKSVFNLLASWLLDGEDLDAIAVQFVDADGDYDFEDDDTLAEAIMGNRIILAGDNGPKGKTDESLDEGERMGEGILANIADAVTTAFWDMLRPGSWTAKGEKAVSDMRELFKKNNILPAEHVAEGYTTLLSGDAEVRIAHNGTTIASFRKGQKEAAAYGDPANRGDRLNVYHSVSRLFESETRRPFDESPCEPLDEAKAIEAFHGRTSNSQAFDYRYIAGEEANDQEGPGFYFTTGEDDARMYGSNVMRVELTPRKLLKKNTKLSSKDKVNLMRLMKDTPELDDVLSDWGLGDGMTTKEAALRKAFEGMTFSGDAFESYTQVWYDFYHRAGNDADWVKSMSKLGIDGVVIPRNGVTHYVMYDPKQIKVLGTV